MLSIEECYKIEPSLRNLEKDKALNIINDLYILGEMAIDDFIRKNDSKNPEWLLSNEDKRVK